MAKAKKTYVVKRRIVMAAATTTYWFGGLAAGGRRWVTERSEAVPLSFSDAVEVVRACDAAARAFGDFHHLHSKEER